jgi:hypothetical protein
MPSGFTSRATGRDFEDMKIIQSILNSMILKLYYILIQWNSVITNTQGTSEFVPYIRSFVLTVRRRYLLRKINNYIGIHKII